MKHKTLFRLLVKAIGVYFTVNGLGSIPQIVGMLVYYLRQGALGFEWIYGFQILDPAIQIGLGLYLFFGGKWIADKAIPGNRPYCQECGYDLTGSVRDRCSECDTPFRPDDVRPSVLMDASEKPESGEQ